MAFKISSATEGTYTWPVPVWLPVDGGKRQRQEFTATFKRFKRGEEPLVGDELEDDDDGVETFKKFLAGWSGIKDDDGNEIQFSDETLREFLKVPVFVSAVTTAFQNSVNQAREKN